MKLKRILVLLVLVLFISSCGKKVTNYDYSKNIDPKDTIFFKDVKSENIDSTVDNQLVINDLESDNNGDCLSTPCFSS